MVDAKFKVQAGLYESPAFLTSSPCCSLSPLLPRAPLGQALVAESPPPPPPGAAPWGRLLPHRLCSLPRLTPARQAFPRLCEPGDFMFTSASLCQKLPSRETFPLGTALLMGPATDGIECPSCFRAQSLSGHGDELLLALHMCLFCLAGMLFRCVSIFSQVSGVMLTAAYLVYLRGLQISGFVTLGFIVQ